MADDNGRVIFGTNRYHGQAACEHCGGVIRHERWCITCDPVVYYAYQIAGDASKLMVADALILHSLGVIWTDGQRQGNCKTASGSPSLL